MVQSELQNFPENEEKGQRQRAPKTLQDILGIIAKSPDLREQRRRVLLSAVRTAARCMVQMPGDILCQPAALQKGLGAVNYLQAGLTKERWRDVRSLTLSALQMAGVKLMPGRRQRSAFSPAWSELRRRSSRRVRIVLSRFMNFCGSHGIDPDDVDAGVFDRFRDELENHSLVRDAKAVYRTTCKQWDRAGTTVEGWPLFRTGISLLARAVSLPWSA